MWRHGVLAAACSVLVAACGGGGEPDPTEGAKPAGGTDPAYSGEAGAFVLDPPVAVPGSHRVKLTWHGPPASQRVSVWLADGLQDFHAIASGLPGWAAEVDLGALWKLDWPSVRLRLRACAGAAPCIDSNAQPLVDALVASVTRLEPPEQKLASVFSSRTALSADGNTLAVADPLDFPSTAPRPPGIGSVSVFRRCGPGCWRRDGYVTNFSVAGNFGDPMALSGDGRMLAVGAYTDGGMVGGVNPPEAGGGESWAGAVHVFVRDDGSSSWRQQAFLKAAQPVAYESFGNRLALDHRGHRLVVGGNRARIHVFVRDGAGTWRQEGLIEEPPAEAALASGRALAVSGNGRGIASAATIPLAQCPYGRIPAALVYTLHAGGGWTRSATLLGKPTGSFGCSDPEQDSFGAALSFDHAGNVLAVGAPTDPADAGGTGNDPGNRGAPRSGAVHVFGATGGTWQRRAFLKAREAAPNDEFGTEVAVSGDGRVLLGKACGYSGNAAGVRRNHRAGTVIGPQDGGGPGSCFWGGGAYVWTQDQTGRWNHASSVIPVATDRVSYGFFSVALSADAMTFALGATLYNPQREKQSRVFVY